MNSEATQAATSRPKLGPNDKCWCGSGAKYKKCHQGQDAKGSSQRLKRVLPGKVSPRRTVPAHIPRPDYSETGIPGAGQAPDVMTRYERMKKACQAAAEILQLCASKLAPGVTTDEIDAICHQAYIDRGGFPSTLNYRGFPKSLCTSVNEVVLHGIPDDRPLEGGDIVNLDVTIYLDGMHGDCSATFGVGPVDPESERLMRVTRECLMKGIEAVKPGGKLNLIGKAIQEHAERHGYGVIRDFCGHGIGELFHCPPSVVHYFDPSDETVIQEGMFFTIEPMLTMGSHTVRQWPDEWTIVTTDGKRSAQFEHTLYVNEHGAEIFTLPAGA